MDKVILYFTRRERLSDLGASLRRLTPFLVNEEVELIGFPEDNPRIYLVYDQFTLEEFKNCVWSKIDALEEVAYVHHSAPKQEVKDFLNSKTNLSLEGSHQYNLSGYEYYTPLKEIIKSRNVTDEQFNELWKKFEEIANINTLSEQAHDEWLTSIPESKKKILPKRSFT